MQCEICGVDIVGSARKVVVEGSELEVCARCSQHGKAAQGWTPVSRKVSPVARDAGFVPKKPKGKYFKEMDDEIVNNYSQVIRDAREAKGWTLEELALKMKEKATLVRKIERSEIIPEDSVRKKFEQALEIKLTERVGREQIEPGTRFKGTTLGDIVTIKKKGK